MNPENVKIVVFVPYSHADIIRKTAGENGCGIIGNYSFCSFSSQGTGRFMPGQGANPHIGALHAAGEVPEERIEFICPKNYASDVIKKIKSVHPYEEAAIDVYPLLSLE